MNIWNFLAEKLGKGKGCFLLTVIKSSGSSPGRQGFKMAVCDDGALYGSIGGGIMEYEIVEEIKTLFKSKKYEPRLIRKYHNKNETGISLNEYSGEQIIIVQPLLGDTLSVINDISNCIDKNQTGILEIMCGSISLEKTSSNKGYRYQTDIVNDVTWKYNEFISPGDTIYIIGAGHVGTALSKIMVNLDFNIVLLDNRENHVMFEDNNHVHTRKIIDFNNIEEYVTEGCNNYVTIMTNSHDNDLLVLSKLIKKELSYIGLLGSQKKRDKFLKHLRNTGVSDNHLKKLHTPAGINIASITPAEIAVSIAAEIINVKNCKGITK